MRRKRVVKQKKELKVLKQLWSLEEPRGAVKKRGPPSRRSRPRKIRKHDKVEDRLIHELVRVTIPEEKIESTLSEAFLALSDESLKQKMYKLAMESAEHYHMLINTVKGLKKFKMKDAPPFKLRKRTMGEILENQLTLVKSATMVYKTILKFLDKLSDKAEIKRGGLRIIPDKLKLCCEKNLSDKKGHISVIEEILSLFKETHIIAYQ